MATASPQASTPERVLLAQVRDCFGRIVYTHKTHEKCADILLGRHTALKHVQIVLSVLVSGTLMTDLIKDELIWPWVPMFLATVLTGVNLYFKNYNFGQLAQAHKETADRLWNIRESYLSLITDLVGGSIDLKLAQARRDELQEMAAAAHASAPRTNSTAYQKAQKALKVKEDLSFSDGEIDKFLPPALQQDR
jgi:hypothetical protein